jgi:hypothetical protein
MENYYKCCRCNDTKVLYVNIIFCRFCNLSSVCNKCFHFMETTYDFYDIVCPLCSQVYYGQLRNSILKYALYYSIGTEKMSLSLLNIWKRN